MPHLVRLPSVPAAHRAGRQEKEDRGEGRTRPASLNVWAPGSRAVSGTRTEPKFEKESIAIFPGKPHSANAGSVSDGSS